MSDKSSLDTFRKRCFTILRESSFNMTRRGNEVIEGGLRKFIGTRKGGSEKIRGRAPNICILQNQQEGVGGS